MDDLKRILQSIQNDIAYMKENTVTKQMLIDSEKRTREAIHSVYEVAVTVEDKAEVGDVLIKSFVDALEERTNIRLDQIDNKLNVIVSSLEDIRKVLQLSLQQDDRFERRLNLHEADIAKLKRKLG